MADLRHWVLIETGGNQRYIFGSSRLRHVAGASQLVHEAGSRWVEDATTPDDELVMTASGKALLLVRDADAGRSLIRKVTTRALTEAPGLRVTGAVGPAFDPADPDAHEPARERTYETHAGVRAARPDVLLRDRVFPWHRLCRDTGQPAAAEERYGDDEPGVPASAGVLARSAARERARERLTRTLGPALADILPAHLDRLSHGGWVAVVHADGNGVGGLFRGFLDHIARVEGTDSVSLETHVRYQKAVAEQLEAATWDAIRDAILALPGAEDGRITPELAGRLLPIVVGGDDVTVACDAALALPFVRKFADAFAVHTAEQPDLRRISEAATGHAGLTASAGIAIVKLHHPFATAYELAETLTVAAKGLPHDGRAPAAVDLHVAHASTRRDLDELRAQADGVARHAGPYLLDAPGDPRSIDHLDTIVRWLEPGCWLTPTQAHALREAADRGIAEYRHQLALAVARPGAPDVAFDLLDVQPEGFLRLFDALHLRGLRLTTPAGGDER